MFEISGYVHDIYESAKVCRFKIEEQSFIYFKVPLAFPSNLKFKTTYAKLMFHDSFVEIVYKQNAKHENIVDEITIDFKKFTEKWFTDFKSYIKKYLPFDDFVKFEVALYTNHSIDKLIEHFDTHEYVKLSNLLKFYRKHYSIIGMFHKLKNDLDEHKIVFTNRELKTAASCIQDFNVFKEYPFQILSSKTNHIFKTILKFADIYNVPFTDFIKGAIKHVLLNAKEKGHTCFPIKNVCLNVIQILAYKKDELMVDDVKNVIETSKQFTIFKEFVALENIYRKEKYISNRIQEYVEGFYDDNNQLENDNEINNFISAYQSTNNVTFNNKQLKMINALFSTTVGIHILTGLPGTGKSSVVRCIKYICEQLSLKCALVAPTGKSANRLGKDAFTIHRLLEVIPEKDGSFVFKHNERNRLDYEVLVVDEVSMLDVNIFYSLLLACNKTDFRLILMGDNNQLPSVDYGDILNCLLASKVIPHIHLTKIYRQDENNPIILLAKSIVSGKIPNMTLYNHDFIEFIEMKDNSMILERIMRIYNSLNGDVQILIPTKSGTVGTIAVNEFIHKSLYNEPEIGDVTKTKYKYGEKIICTANTYFKNEKGEVNIAKSVFNGECGIFEKYTESQTGIIVSDSKKVSCPIKNLDYGYAISVHKSQGSEYKNVLIVLHDSQSVMLNRQVLYTAVTRAKNNLKIIGTYDTIKKCVETNNNVRLDILDDLIVDGLEIIEE